MQCPSLEGTIWGLVAGLAPALERGCRSGTSDSNDTGANPGPSPRLRPQGLRPEPSNLGPVAPNALARPSHPNLPTRASPFGSAWLDPPRWILRAGSSARALRRWVFHAGSSDLEPPISILGSSPTDRHRASVGVPTRPSRWALPNRASAPPLTPPHRRGESVAGSPWLDAMDRRLDGSWPPHHLACAAAAIRRPRTPLARARASGP